MFKDVSGSGSGSDEADPHTTTADCRVDGAGESEGKEGETGSSAGLSGHLRSKRVSRRQVVVGVALAAILLVAALAAVWFVSSPVSSCGVNALSPLSSGGTRTLVSCGMQVEIAPSSFVSYMVPRITDSMELVGAFSANRSVGAYLVNSSVFTQMSGGRNLTGPPPEYTWGTGNVTHLSFSVKVPGSPGQYYLVLENLHGAPVGLVWTSALVLNYQPTAPA